MLPDDLRGVYANYLEDMDTEVRRIVKAADKISALVKCLEEQKMGNGDFASAERSIREYLENSELPEVALFLREFLPSYGLELDALQSNGDRQW